MNWSKVAWHCTRDWLVLIIKTATRLSDDFLVKIQEEENRIKYLGLPGNFKKKLDELNKEVKEFYDHLLNSKINKLRKDVKKFSLERTFPYTKSDYTPESRAEENAGSDNQSTGSDSSGSDR